METKLSAYETFAALMEQVPQVPEPLPLDAWQMTLTLRQFMVDFARYQREAAREALRVARANGEPAQITWAQNEVAAAEWSVASALEALARPR